MINEVTWMDKKSKKAAFEKAEAIESKIGYPDYIYNQTYLDSLYKEVIILSNKYLVYSNLNKNFLFRVGRLGFT